MTPSLGIRSRSIFQLEPTYLYCEDALPKGNLKPENWTTLQNHLGTAVLYRSTNNTLSALYDYRRKHISGANLKKKHISATFSFDINLQMCGYNKWTHSLQ